jgi:glycosyltransferase involved in cell wall biosynthesis
MKNPKISIVIPVRNGMATIHSTLATIVSQDFEDIEVVISDNFSDPPITGVSHQKVRLVHPEKPCSQAASWDFAIKQARGEFIMLFGCDDGLMPGALTRLNNYIVDHPEEKVVRYNRVYYVWPQDVFGPQRNTLQVYVGDEDWILHPSLTIPAVANCVQDYTTLPMLYTSLIHRSIIEKMIETTGRVFWTRSPDVYSGFVIAYINGTYKSLGYPMTICGASDHSLGFSSAIGDSPIMKDEMGLVKNDDVFMHPDIPDGLHGLAPHIADAFLTARDHYGFPGHWQVRVEEKDRLWFMNNFRRHGNNIVVNCGDDIRNVADAAAIAGMIADEALWPSTTHYQS